MMIPQVIRRFGFGNDALRGVLATGAFVAAAASGVWAQSNYATPYTFGTFVGSSTDVGTVDGMGSAARFSAPRAIAVDLQGNLYVAETTGCVIRKITPAGAVTTLAGSPGVIGSADGQGSAARFNAPRGIAVDAAGTVYVSDTENNTIRKITPAGLVSTFAGVAGTSGSVDGAGSGARFDSPIGLAVDAGGNVFVADSSNVTIRKITPDGNVTTFAGLARSQGFADGVGTAARFRFPEGLAIDSAGNLYVANDYDGTIRKITPGRLVTTLAGTHADPKTFGSIGNADGVGPAAGFSFPLGIAVDGAGNVYVTDTDNYTIRKITPDGTVTTIAGSIHQAAGTDGSGSDVRFWAPNGIAVDAAGNLYVTDAHPINTGAPTSFIYPGTIRKGSVTALPTPATARLGNLSARANVGTDSNILIVGFVVGGSGSKNMLLRGAGPTLSGFGVANYLVQPSLGLFNAQSAQITSNAGWNNSASLGATFKRVGAFAYPANSTDSAIETSLATNTAFTAQVSGVNRGTGVSIAEIYDADPDVLTSASRLANLSARANVGTGADVLIAGFVVGGTGSDRVLIRGIGPALANYGLSGLLAKPVLTLFDVDGNVITTDQGWQNAPSAPAGIWTGRALPVAPSHADFSHVGAFDVSDGSADCALIVTLPPGNYTAQISGLNGTVGVAEVEVYEDN
jgi:sugar lactone lactonase YvrE